MMQKIIIYLKLMRFHRPIGIWLLLWPILWALWIAKQGTPDFKILTIFILGTVVMRAAGCVINDFADRKFDGFVTRTKDRPLASGQVSIKEAGILFFILCISALALVLQLNSFTIKLSVVALLLATIYPFTKRITYWPQFFLGLAFAWGVPMAFAAQTNHITNIAWWIFAVAVLWPLAYDTMYAMVDQTDDKKIGIKSTAILFGRYNQFIIGIIQILILGLLIFIGIQAQLKLSYYFSLAMAAGLFSYQQYLIKDHNPQQCFKAFLNNQWAGLIIFLGIFTSF
jgi:4-hydroxybenzoate polyprenyltransferase